MTTIERSLATVETIGSLHPIDGADAIVRARVRGWDAVVRLDEFQAGDRVVYFEVDSHLDVAEERFAFLEPRGTQTSEAGFTGHVLKTVRLRGQYSQGLVLPASQFPEVDGFAVGADATDALSIVKWDPALPDEVLSVARGFLPSWIPATSEHRIQNDASILTAPGTSNWVATEKIDGESMTIWADGAGEYGVAGRTLDLIDDGNNVKWGLARSTGLLELITQMAADTGLPTVVQGEHFGLGAARNSLRLADVRFLAFAVYVNSVELPRSEWPVWLLAQATPVFDLAFPASADEALAQVDGLKSLVAPQRLAEGVVWRSTTSSSVTLADGRVRRASAKVLSNKYLMRNSG
jgi:RNA ligase (TIGR02306 family)